MSKFSLSWCLVMAFERWCSGTVILHWHCCRLDASGQCGGIHRGGAEVHLLRNMAGSFLCPLFCRGGALRDSGRGPQWCQLPHWFQSGHGYSM